MTLVTPPTSEERTIIRRIRLALTSLSFISALFAIFIILSCKDASSRNYSRLILASVVLSLLFEMYLQLVLDPVLLLPTPCVFRDEPILDIPGRASVHHLVFVLLYEFDVPVIISCFIHRHQAVMAPGSRWSFTPRAQLIPPLVIGLIILIYPAILISYTQPPGAMHQYAEMISDSWPTEAIATADCFDPEIIAVLCILVLTFFGLFAIFVIVIVSHTFATLYKHAAISEKMRGYHLTMTRVLVLQSIVPVVFVVFPYSLYVLALFLEMKPLLILPICMTIMSAHSLVHSLVVITTTPIYRRQILSLLRQQRLSRLRVSSLSSQKKCTDNIEIINQKPR